MEIYDCSWSLLWNRVEMYIGNGLKKEVAIDQIYHSGEICCTSQECRLDNINKFPQTIDQIIQFIILYSEY